MNVYWQVSEKINTVASLLVNFLPSWWFGEYGISNGEQMFLYPDHRARMLQEMNRIGYNRFGDLGFGAKDPPLVFDHANWANATMPAALGCEVVYYDDKHPVSLPLDPEKIEGLNVPLDILSCFPMCEMARQAEYIADKHDQQVTPHWSTMGLQNIAMLVRGSDIFADYFDRPEHAHRLLEIAFDAIIISLEHLKANIPDLGVWSHQNCTVALVGPDIYKEHLFSWEQKLYGFIEKINWRYNIHHCGNFDRFAGIYRQLGQLDSFQIGWGSDLRLALDTFPECKIDYLISPTMVKDSTKTDIYQSMKCLVDQAGDDIERVSFTLSDVEQSTPDDNIRAVVDGFLK